jgi:hypothetical protein
MHETEADLVVLQSLLDRSYAVAGDHLRRVITQERRLDAAELAARLTGVCLLSLATVSSRGRPVSGPVDGIFYRGAFHFGTAPDSVRVRHIRRRPAVSAVHLPGEELAVTVHGRAVFIDLDAAEHAGYRRTLLDIYVPRYGTEWERMLENGATYLRIDAEKMFTFHMEEGGQ